MACIDVYHRSAWLAFSLSLLFLGCNFQITPPLIKIGMAAPFEGEYRSIGYDALGGVKLAIAEANEAGGVRGYMVELVALNDNADPEAAREQAYELTLDPQVMGVIGHFRQDTTLAATAIYHQAGVAFVATFTPRLTVNDQEFIAKYRELTGGEPGPWAIAAYDATKILLSAIDQAINTDGQPTREGVIQSL